jgi:hypothetical protein
MPEVPVIIYSAFDDPVTEKAAPSAKVSTFVSKSERMSVLRGTARNLVERIAA